VTQGVLEPARGLDANTLIGQRLGKFLIRRVIGEGGMGFVLEAEHELTKRVGALKLLRPHYLASGAVVQRFLREASAAGRIGNPHIVETLDAGEFPSGAPYIFMELLQGQSLRAHLKRHGSLSLSAAGEVVMQAATGLSAAHAAGIVHRDIKPDNLFLCTDPPNFIKLLDFGISKFMVGSLSGHELTQDGVPMGTPAYMSPEQVLGKSAVGAASDVYSLAVVLYECITGIPPFGAGPAAAISARILHGSYVPASRLVQNLPPELDLLLQRALKRDESLRLPTAQAFMEALAPILARAEERRSPAHRSRKWALTALALVAASVGLLFAFQRHVTTHPPPSPSAQPARLPSAAKLPSLPTATTAASLRAVTETTELSVPSTIASSGEPPGPPASAPHRNTSRSAASARPTRAARDGLSEHNPF
jgi:serine/threonine-protein kinase